MYEYSIKCFIRQGYFGMTADDWNSREEPIFSKEIRSEFNDLIINVSKIPGVKVMGCWDDICSRPTFTSKSKAKLRDAVLDLLAKVTGLGIKVTAVDFRKLKEVR